MHVQCSVMSNFVTPWTVACQAPWSLEFSGQEYWSWLPFPSPGDFPDQVLNSHLLHLLHWQSDSVPLCHLGNLKRSKGVSFILIALLIFFFFWCNSYHKRRKTIINIFLFVYYREIFKKITNNILNCALPGARTWDPTMTRSWRDLTSKADQDFRDSEKLPQHSP